MRNLLLCACSVLLAFVFGLWATQGEDIGREVAISHHLQDGEEFAIPVHRLLKYGEKLFRANFTVQEGAGRPLAKGTANGALLSDPSDPLVFPRNFNRLSGPDANSCAGCHNQPFIGGSGDRATAVFVLGQRFDFLTFDHNDSMFDKGSLDERGMFVTHNDGSVSGSNDFANERKTIGMFGSGFIEMLARHMTADLQRIRNATPAGHARALGCRLKYQSLTAYDEGSIIEFLKTLQVLPPGTRALTTSASDEE